MSQGIGLATGLQKKFDWAGVAAAGVEAGAMAGVEEWSPFNDQVDTITTPEGDTIPEYAPNVEANGFIGGMADLLANAATRSLINGSDFGDNILAALPDTIGQTIGNMIADGINSQDDTSSDGDLTEFSRMIDKYAAQYEASGNGAANNGVQLAGDFASDAVDDPTAQVVARAAAQQGDESADSETNSGAGNGSAAVEVLLAAAPESAT
ncbi:MAG: DUF637 domain-containing protein [Alphaproteobacteria bacterium]|nr:DUF637 domain-containing protein [Alphaproteobacteria bacterium]